MLSATLGGVLRRPATPPVKSATPRVAAEARAAPGEKSWFRLWIVSEARPQKFLRQRRLFGHATSNDSEMAQRFRIKTQIDADAAKITG